MATVRVRILILTVRITLSAVCPFNCMAHTANTAVLVAIPGGLAVVLLLWGWSFFTSPGSNVGWDG
jgi:hypothetical protein